MKYFYKNSTLVSLLFISIILFSIFLPNSLFAAKSDFLPIIQCGIGEDPCTFIDAVEMINRLVNWFVSIAATLGAVTVAYAGSQILLNPGNASKLEDAKKMFYKTLMGLFWLLAAWLIIYTIIERFVSSDIGALRFLKG